MGIFGLLAFMAFLTNLLILAFKDYRSLKDRILYVILGQVFGFSC